MAVKQTGQLSLAEALLSGRGSVSPLDRLAGLVKWPAFDQLLAPLRDGGPGRPAWPPLVLFKALLLQSLYGLSDRELEEALCDRLSFRRFVGLSLEETIPDFTVLNRFRNLLIEVDLLEKLFGELDRQLEEAGVILKRGTMLDATLIEAVAAPPSGERPSHDPDARFGGAKGKGGFTFGYKAHVGVDQGSGLIRSVITTPANVNDTVPADELIRGDERAVWADAAYDTHRRRARLKATKQTPSRAAAAAPAIQSPDRPKPGRRRDHLRHAQEPHAAEGHPLYRPGQGRGPSALGRDRLQPATLGCHHRLAAPQPRSKYRQTDTARQARSLWSPSSLPSRPLRNSPPWGRGA
jgi:transposase, IS5 family